MLSADVPKGLADMACPDMGFTEAVSGPTTPQRKVALISTAGLHHEGDAPFALGGSDYRILDTEDDRPLQMSHISTNFDRSGFAQDLNVVFPLQRLQELAGSGQVGSVSRYHYSFMGATDPESMAPAAKDLAEVLAGDDVDLVCLIPV